MILVKTFFLQLTNWINLDFNRQRQRSQGDIKTPCLVLEYTQFFDGLELRSVPQAHSTKQDSSRQLKTNDLP